MAFSAAMEADLLGIDECGIERRPPARIPHWRDMRRLMQDPESNVKRPLK